jgi:anti-sigma factor RsiW
MKTEDRIKLQAYVDGELGAGDLVQVEEWLKQDSEARTEVEFLRQIKALLKDGELARTVPVSRDFYWSQIERRIQSAASRPVSRHHGVNFWFWRVFAPLGVAAGVVFYLSNPSVQHAKLSPKANEVIDAPIPGTSTITFQGEGLSVVWVDVNGI